MTDNLKNHPPEMEEPIRRLGCAVELMNCLACSSLLDEPDKQGIDFLAHAIGEQVELLKRLFHGPDGEAAGAKEAAS